MRTLGARHDTKKLSTMHTTISQILYPNRQAFFEKLALSLPSQPAIRIGLAPPPTGLPRAGSRNMRKAVPTQTLCTAQRGMRSAQAFAEDELISAFTALSRTSTRPS
jgi:hypothetical protein